MELFISLLTGTFIYHAINNSLVFAVLFTLLTWYSLMALTTWFTFIVEAKTLSLLLLFIGPLFIFGSIRKTADNYTGLKKADYILELYLFKYKRMSYHLGQSYMVYKQKQPSGHMLDYMRIFIS